jgi:integrase
MVGFPARTASFPTRKLAERWAKTVEASMIEGRHIRSTEGRRRTLKEAIDRYERDIAPTLKSGKRVVIYLRWWQAAPLRGKTLGDLRLHDLTPDVIDEQIARLRSEPYTRARPEAPRSAVEGPPKQYQRGNDSVRQHVAALSRLCTLARRRWRWMSSNPFDQIERPKPGKGRTLVLTAEQRARLLATIEADQSPDGLLLDLMVRIGLGSTTRAGELLKLTWGNVDLAEGRLQLGDTKNGDSRVAFVFGSVLDRLRAQKESARTRGRAGDAVLVFASNHRDGAVFDYYTKYRSACEAAGIPRDVVYHTLRHQSATDLARAGATEQQLRAIGGWRSDVVRRYVHLAAEDARHVVEKMNRETFGPDKV